MSRSDFSSRPKHCGGFGALPFRPPGVTRSVSRNDFSNLE